MPGGPGSTAPLSARPAARAPDESRSAPAGFVARVLLVIALVALAFALWSLRDVLLLVFGAVLVAVVLDAVAAPARRFLRMPHGIALALGVLVVFGGIGTALWLFGAEVREQVRTLGESIPAAWAELRERVEELLPGGVARGWLSESLPGSSSVLSSVQGIFVSVGAGLTDLLLVIVGGIYIAANPKLYRRGLMKLVPTRRRALADEAFGDCGRALRLWLLGQGVSMLIVGVLTAIGLWWLGVPSAVALGLVTGLLDFVPVVGPIVALVPALLLALAQDAETALWTVGLYVAVQQVEGNVVQPLVQQRAVDLPAAVLIFAILAAGLLFGGLGVVLAAPLAVVLFVMIKRLYVREALDTPTDVPGERKSGD
jgi:predicted PurR-regulated permease PerM